MGDRLSYEDIKNLIKEGKPIPDSATFTLPMDVHHWFELTYAQYLTIPRSIMQAMPYEWQYRFVELLNELDNTFDWRPKNGCYRVLLSEEAEKWNESTERLEFAWGEDLEDPLAQYRHPNRKYIESLRSAKQAQVGDIRVDAIWSTKNSGFVWKAYRQWCQYDVLIAESGDAAYQSPDDAIAAAIYYFQDFSSQNYD